MDRRRRRLLKNGGTAFVVLFAALLALVRSGDPVSGDGGDVAALFAARTSGVMVTVEGRVQRVLADDREGSAHQRFILELADGHTVLVAHNIDLAPRVADLGRGDVVTVRGQYEWNERGGVLHWTHHDPQGGRPGGWIGHDGRTYR